MPGRNLDDRLLDHSEDRVAGLVVHPDPDRVAALEELGPGLAFEDRLDRSHLGDAAVAEAALVDRLAGAAALIAVGDGAGADDRAGPDVPGLRQMGDQGSEVEGHVDPGVGAAEGLAVEIDLEGAVELAVPEAVAELLGGDEDRRQSRGGLRLEEAEALAELAGDEVAQADVVDQPDEQDVGQRV